YSDEDRVEFLLQFFDRHGCPTSTPVSNVTPMLRTSSTSLRLSAGRNLYSAMPYVFKPPGRVWLSKIVTATPLRRSSAAQASDAGPPPTQATRRESSVGTGSAGLCE